MTAPADSAAAPPEPATPTARIGHEERDVVLRHLSSAQALEDEVLEIPRAEAVFPPAS